MGERVKGTFRAVGKLQKGKWQNLGKDMEAGKADFQYNTVSEANVWKVDFIKEIIDVRNDDLAVDNDNNNIFPYTNIQQT